MEVPNDKSDRSDDYIEQGKHMFNLTLSSRKKITLVEIQLVPH